MDKKYKKHPDGIDLWSVPPHVVRVYKMRFDYRYIKINDCEMPISDMGYHSIKQVANIKDDDSRIMTKVYYSENYFYIPDIAEICNLDLNDYMKGFLDGYNSDFNTFTGTLESKVENLIGVLSKMKGLGQKMEWTKYVGFVDLYADGFHEGRQYRAWEYIFQTPNEFLKHDCFMDFIERQSSSEAGTESPPPHFTRLFTDAERQNLYDGLVSGGFIPKDTNRDHFYFAICGTEIPDNEKPFKRIQWSVTNKKSKGKNPNIRALLELLVLTGISETEIKNKPLINFIFEISNGTTIQAKHYTDITDKKGNLKQFESEYHTELSNIVNKSKEKASL